MYGLQYPHLLLHFFKTEVVTDTKGGKVSKRKQIKTYHDDNTPDQEKEKEKNRPFDFYKFAEVTAAAINVQSENLQSGSNKNYGPPPRWLNKRPKITYSTMCAMAIRVSILRIWVKQIR